MSHLPDSTLSIPFEVWFEELLPGYPIIRVSNAHASATVALHGAHVIDYIPEGQAPVLFTSCEAQFSEGKAIRGGIPICWPWFSAHPSDSQLPSHGFARNRFWKLVSTRSLAEATELTLSLDTSELGLSYWPQHTTASVTITIGKSLQVALTTTNHSDQSITVGGALHSYLYLGDVRECSLSGLEGTSFIDTTNEQTGCETQPLRIDREIDRIYTDTSTAVTITDPQLERHITIEKSGSLSTVIWNPWTEKAAALGDLGDSEFPQFVCVEACNARSDVHTLAPGASHTLSTTLVSRPTPTPA